MSSERPMDWTHRVRVHLCSDGSRSPRICGLQMTHTLESAVTVAFETRFGCAHQHSLTAEEKATNDILIGRVFAREHLV